MDLRHRGLGFHHHRSGAHTYMIQIVGNLVMIWLHICSTPSIMTCHNILRGILDHHLVHTLFEDAYLFYEDFQPLCIDFEEYQDMDTSEQSNINSSKRKYFHLGYFHGDSQGKRRCFSSSILLF
jgi:hypothetical protein